MTIEYKIAKTKEDLDHAFKVRYDVFVKECDYIPESNYVADRESDSFDTLETTVHFLALDNGRGVGTARMLFPNEEVAKRNNWIYGFDMERLFDLSDYKNKEIPIVELPRSCVRKEYRKHNVIQNLWRMAIQYAARNDVYHILGSGATETDSIEDAKLLYKVLDAQGYISKEFQTPAKEKHNNNNPRFRIYNQIKEELLKGEDLKKMKIPGTINIFTKVGIRFTGEPVFYPKFRMCTIPLLEETKKTKGIFGKMVWDPITEEEWTNNQIKPR